MYTALVALSNKKLTRKELKERLAKYSSFADVPEYPYCDVKVFKKEFNASLKELPKRISRYEGLMKEDSRTRKVAKEMHLPMIEVLSKKDLKAYIEYIGHGAYLVEGDTVYCTKNYKDGKFDFLDFNEKWLKLYKKSGRDVTSCKVAEWDIYGSQSSIYELLYDYDNDKWYGDTIHGLKEYEEWQKNYGTLVESIGATYAYAVPYHY